MDAGRMATMLLSTVPVPGKKDAKAGSRSCGALPFGSLSRLKNRGENRQLNVTALTVKRYTSNLRSIENVKLPLPGPVARRCPLGRFFEAAWVSV
jgi:hypothetical protein